MASTPHPRFGSRARTDWRPSRRRWRCGHGDRRRWAAQPVDASLPITRVRSTLAARSSARASLASASCPTAPASITDAPSRAAATAWLAPLPPGSIRTCGPSSVSPARGMAGKAKIRSRLMEPNTTIIGCVRTGGGDYSADGVAADSAVAAHCGHHVPLRLLAADRVAGPRRDRGARGRAGRAGAAGRRDPAGRPPGCRQDDLRSCVPSAPRRANLRWKCPARHLRSCRNTRRAPAGCIISTFGGSMVRMPWKSLRGARRAMALRWWNGPTASVDCVHPMR